MRSLLVTLLPTALALPSFPGSINRHQRPLPLSNSEISCPLAPKITPDTTDGLLPSLHLIQNETIRGIQADRLSRAVQVPTSVSDYMTDPEDEGFAPFLDFQDLLRELFPLVYAPQLPENSTGS